MKLKKMKHWILFALVLLILAALIVGAVFLFGQKKSEDDPEIRFHLPNYEENIFENKAYMSFQRNLRYSVSGIEQLYSYENDYEDAGVECKFFLDYFQTIISGKYEELSKFYVENFFETKPKFTMQMIYEPYVLFHSTSEDEIDGEKVTLINFHVEYKIFKNNGTFRNDLPSNTAVPQIYQLVKLESGEYQIYRILDVVNE